MQWMARANCKTVQDVRTATESFIPAWGKMRLSTFTTPTPRRKGMMQISHTAIRHTARWDLSIGPTPIKPQKWWIVLLNTITRCMRDCAAYTWKTPQLAIYMSLKDKFLPHGSHNSLYKGWRGQYIPHECQRSLCTKLCLEEHHRRLCTGWRH